MICNNLYLTGRFAGICAFVHLCKMAKVAKVARRRCCRGKSSSDAAAVRVGVKMVIKSSVEAVECVQLFK